MRKGEASNPSKCGATTPALRCVFRPGPLLRLPAGGATLARMAGRPGRRDKAATPDDIPEATSRADARNAPAGAPTGARGRGRARDDVGNVTPLPRSSPGPHVRTTTDRAAAETLADLSAQLRPGVVLRLERLQPRWAAGWLEDFALEGGDGIGELLGYLAEEYGGRLYRVTVIQGGHVMYDSRVPIAGPPRHAGRIINRARWMGEDEPPAAPAAPAAPPASGTGDLAQLLTMVLDANRRAGDAQTESLTRALDQANRQQADLMALVTQERTEAARGASLPGQLDMLIESTKALRKAGRVFGAAAENGRASESDGGLLETAKSEAAKHFVQSVFSSMGTPNTAPAQNAPTKPAGGRRMSLDAIPEAKPRNK